MTPNYDFQKDLPVARKTENEVCRLLCNTFNLKFVSDCRDNRYDLMMENSSGHPVTFEVKEDFTHARTGNIGVEFECRGKPSGISVCQADFYVYKVHNSDNTTCVYLIRKSKLQKMIADKLYHRIVNGGDIGSNSMNYLFKDSVFYAQARRIA